MPQRAFITGVTGFVGGYLARHLLATGDQVLGSSPDGQWERASEPGLGQHVELVPWELGHREGLSPDARRRIVDFRPTVVYHLAALSVPADCGPDEPAPLAVAVNVEGTRQVVELAAGLPSPARVLFVSTSHVYGPRTKGTARVDEQTPLAPRGGYARTKAAGEEVVQQAVERGECPAVIVRAFQHSGPRQPSRLMLPEWASQFAAGASPVKIHTCDAHVDLSDVRDVVRAYRLVAERGEPGEVFCVGSGNTRRTGDIFQQLRAMADPRRPFVETRPGEKFDPIADISRLQKRTGWQPEIPLEQTLEDTLRYWQQEAAAGRL